MFANRHDITDWVDRYGEYDVPNLGTAALTLQRLQEQVDSMSDGWGYWRAGTAAGGRLVAALQVADVQYRRGGELRDLTDAELKRALIPVKSFLTRHHVAHSDVLL